MAQKSRVSVSAEVFGKYHVKEEWKAKVINKSEEAKNKIHDRLI
jgi:cAMP-dependent protein kinase regulator